jgi:hypothetical protein
MASNVGWCFGSASTAVSAFWPGYINIMNRMGRFFRWERAPGLGSPGRCPGSTAATNAASPDRRGEQSFFDRAQVRGSAAELERGSIEAAVRKARDTPPVRPDPDGPGAALADLRSNVASLIAQDMVRLFAPEPSIGLA